MSSKYAVLGIALSISAASSIGFAQQISGNENIETLQVTGSRFDGASNPGSTVFSREQIDLINPASTVDLLERIPHINITQNGQTGGLSYVSIRGGESNFTLIMIDGITVNDPTNSRGGGFDFSQLDPASIERVEVYRGGISAIHGGDAISGVIHFITRKGNGQQLRVEVGTDQQRNGSASFSYNNGEGLSVLANLASRHQKQNGNAQSENQQGLLKLNWQQPQQQQQLLVSYSDMKSTGFAEDSGGQLYANPLLPEKRDAQQWLVGYQGEFDLVENIMLNLSLSMLDREEFSDHPGVMDGVFSGIPASQIESSYKKYEAEAYMSWILSSHLSMLGGVNLRQADGSNNGFLDFGFPLPVDFKLEQDTQSLFIETNYNRDGLNLTAGVRGDKSDDFDSETSYRLSADYAVAEQVSVFAVYNEGYKLPSFFALAHPLVGNPDLNPEKSENVELGVSLQRPQQYNLVVTYFDNKFTDLVDFDAELFTNVNRKQVNTNGIELTGEFWITEHVRVLGDVSYIEVDVVGEAQTLRRRPKWSGGLTLEAQLDKWLIALFSDFRDQYQDSSIATGQISLPGYAKVGASAQYQMNDNLNFNLNIDNMLGKAYQDSVGFGINDAQVRAGMTYQF